MVPFLTIAIPTFNHHNLLKVQVANLLPQLTADIKLIIIDNHSNPPIKQFLENEGIKTSLFSIIENNQNIGGDANILKCLKISKTEWVWVLSDNDIVKSNAISTILNLIKHNQSKVFINVGNDAKVEMIGVKEFFEKLDYQNSFTISNSLYNMRQLYPYLEYYENSISTHQGQILFVFKYFEKNLKAEAIQTKDDIFLESLPPTWNKLWFIKSSFNISNFLEKENRKLFNQTIGLQIWEMLISLSIIGRCYEQLQLREYINIYFNLFKYFHFSLFSKKYFYKLNLLFIITILFKNFYPLYRKRKNLFQYEYSTKS